MLVQQTIDHLRTLKLAGMAQYYSDMKNNAAHMSLDNDEFIGLLVEAEMNERAVRRQKRLFRAAKFKVPSASIEDINYSADRGLDRKLMTSLANCHWIERQQHIIMTGPTGVGKTWLSCALGHQAVRKDMTVLYFRFTRLLEDLEIARGDGTLPKLRTKLTKASLLILDDWAVAPLCDRGRQDLFEVVEDKMGMGSLLIASQLPLEQWHDYIGEPTIADAILDRIVHRSHRIALDGDSLRKIGGLKQEDK